MKKYIVSILLCSLIAILLFGCDNQEIIGSADKPTSIYLSDKELGEVKVNKIKEVMTSCTFIPEHFQKELSKEDMNQMIPILNEVYDFYGVINYSAENIYNVELSEENLSILISPKELDKCYVLEEKEEVSTLFDLEVLVSEFRFEDSSIYYAEFKRDDLYYRIETKNNYSLLKEAFISLVSKETIDLSPFENPLIPMTKKQELSKNEAFTDNDFGKYVVDIKGYDYKEGVRIINQDSDLLHIIWKKDNESIDMTVSKVTDEFLETKKGMNAKSPIVKIEDFTMDSIYFEDNILDINLLVEDHILLSIYSETISDDFDIMNLFNTLNKSNKQAINENVELIPISKLVEGKQKIGYIDGMDCNNIMLDFKYDLGGEFDKDYGYAIVSVSGKYGLINKNGEYMIEPVYNELSSYFDGFLYGRKDGKYFVIDYEGKEYFKGNHQIIKEDNILYYKEGTNLYYFDREDQRFELYEESNMVSELNYLNLLDSFNIFYDEGRYKYILGDKEYDKISFLSKEYVEVKNKKDDLGVQYFSGVCDKLGHLIIGTMYSDIIYYGDDYFSCAEMGSDEYYIENNMKRKAIFHKDKMISDLKYYLVEYIKDDIFYVFDGEDYYFLNMKTLEKIDTELSGNLKFKVYDHYVLAYVDPSMNNGFDFITYILKDLKEVKTYKKELNLEDVMIIYELAPEEIYNIFYPRISYHKAVDEKINNKLKELFLTDKKEKYMENNTYLSIDETSFFSFYSESFNHKLISFIKNEYSYSGGAHGIYQEISYVFSLDTGDYLQLKDVFKESIYDEIPELLLDYIEKHPSLGVHFKSDVHKERLDYLRRDNYIFYFDKDNLIIIYQPYEIASFAAGVVKIPIPLEKISDYLK